MKAFLSILLCLAIFTTGCHKDLPGYPNPFKHVKITKLKGNPAGLTDKDSVVISYNDRGNPVSLIRNYPTYTAPSYFCLYDNKGRLSDYYSIIGNDGGFENWWRFHYDNRNRIYIDTMFEFGIIGPGYPIPYGIHLWEKWISTYEYDNRDRIIASKDSFGNCCGDTSVIRHWYVYNAAGNLERVRVINPLTEENRIDTFYYDTKPSFRTTNKIWQFLDRDYSVNNRLPVQAYNAYGLPTMFDYSGLQQGSFASMKFTVLSIEYGQ